MTKQQYIRSQQIVLNRLMKAYVPKVEACIRAQINEAIIIIKKNGVAMSVGKIHSAGIDSELHSVIKDLYRSAAAQAASRFKYTKREKKAGFGFNLTFITDVLDYLERFLLEKVVLPISRTTVDYIDQVLQAAVENGWGVDRMVKELEDTDIPQKRARLIVRTEAVRAMNFSQLAAADSEDWEMEKQWIAIEDKRTRNSHSHRSDGNGGFVGVDGQRVDLYEPFSNGLMFPGDPTAPAAEVCNCRCTLGYFAKRDLQGNLVPKKNKVMNLASILNLQRLAA